MKTLYIATDENMCRYGSKDYVEPYLPQATRFCVDIVSDELYEAIIQVGGMKECSKAVAFMLYAILDKKPNFSNN